MCLLYYIQVISILYISASLNDTYHTVYPSVISQLQRPASIFSMWSDNGNAKYWLFDKKMTTGYQIQLSKSDSNYMVMWDWTIVYNVVNVSQTNTQQFDNHRAPRHW